MRNKLKIILSILVILFLIYLTYRLYPIIINLTTVEGRIKFKLILEHNKLLAILILHILHLLQMILLILPGEPIEILYGLCFNAFYGTILIFITILINTSLIVLFTKKYGKKFINLFFNKESVEKIENKIIKSNNLSLIILLIFLIPGTPKDLFTFIGGLLPINYKKFILISTFARFPSIISSTLVGASILEGSIIYMVIVYLLSYVLVLIILIIIKSFNKDLSYNDIFRLTK